MAKTQVRSYWLITSVLLAVLTIAAGFIVWLRYEPEYPLEISLPPAPNYSGTILLSGGVANPGLYPFRATDTIESLIQAAGGISAGSNLSNVKLSFIPEGTTGPQRININRAEPWLLEALPGVGTTLAQRIVEYRDLNGPFRSASELLKVNGMGTKTYQQLEQLITVGD